MNKIDKAKINARIKEQVRMTAVMTHAYTCDRSGIVRIGPEDKYFNVWARFFKFPIKQIWECKECGTVYAEAKVG